MTTGAKAEQRLRIGVISDTHGYLHPDLPALFHPVARIIHAGDIGGPEILAALGRIAAVTAVRGNMDTGRWAAALPELDLVEFENQRLAVLHDRDRLDFSPHRTGIKAVISGHTHHPQLKSRNGVLFLNPGSASQPRCRQPATVAFLEVIDGRLSARFVELSPPAAT